MKKKIVSRPIVESFSNWTSNVHPVLRQIYQSRKVDSEQQLNYSLALLPSPDLFSGMSGLVEILSNCLKNQNSILIVADFDADGATSCAVAKRGLEMLGANRVSYIVPNRFEFGYGLTPEIVDIARLQEPEVIITVDNGISSVEGVEAAREYGIRVLITDHHLPGSELPRADAIVNPNMPGDKFPSKSLAGVGVIFYVLSALRKKLRESAWFQEKNIAEPNLAQLLDFVALGTVADVVQLDHVNRILVHQGLKRIQKGVAHVGIRAILDVAARNYSSLVASDLGFAIGPRLNAAGRLDDMSLGIECLLTDSVQEASEIAKKLDALNQERKNIELRMKGEALELLETINTENSAEMPAGICLYDERWHQGVVGIIASRIKDRTGRPVIAFATAETDTIKGSARSVPGIHIRDLLSEIAALNPELLTKFGGHAMAAGLTLRLSDYTKFTSLFSEAIQNGYADRANDQLLYTDGELQGDLITLEFANLLGEAGPWGQGFSEPVFEVCFDVLECRILKDVHLKFSLCAQRSKQILDAIAFNVEDPEFWLEHESIRFVYRLNVNEFRNRQTVQLMVEYMEPC